jgi:hypothetical protein
MLARSNGYRFIYTNVVADKTSYTLPQNIVDVILPFEPDISIRREDYRASDTFAVIVLQKVFDTPYVAPIDVPTGTRTDIKSLEERYWSVFKPDAFRDLPGPRPLPDRWRLARAARRLLRGCGYS